MPSSTYTIPGIRGIGRRRKLTFTEFVSIPDGPGTLFSTRNAVKTDAIRSMYICVYMCIYESNGLVLDIGHIFSYGRGYFLALSVRGQRPRLVAGALSEKSAENCGMKQPGWFPPS